MMSSLTMVAFSFSKRLLWEPDHWMISCKKKDRYRTVFLPVSPLHLSHLSTCLTSPRSSMKLSPWLKLSQLTGTSVALTTCRPLTCSSRWTSTSLVTTCWNPEATPPFCVRGNDVISATNCCHWVLVCCSCSYHVLKSSFEVPYEGTGLVTLDLTVLDWCPLQVIIHLHGKNGRRATLILRTLWTCRTTNQSESRTRVT